MKIYIPVGTTASGKTTKCKQWVKENQPAVIVEADDLRTIFFKEYKYDPKLEPTIRLILESCVMHWLDAGYNVAVDDAVFFLTKDQRADFANYVLIPEEDELIWDFLPVPTDYEVLKRRKLESRGIDLKKWVEIKNHHASILESGE